MATSKKSDVAVKAAGEVSIFAQESIPDYIKKDGGRGSEEVKSSDLVLPRLELVQAGSPIKDDNDDAREGMLFNSVTGELYGDLVYFVPIYYRVEWLVWIDKETAGGGFLGSFATEEQADARRRQALQDDPKLAGKTDKGFDIVQVVDTPVHFGLRVTPEGHMEQIVISMAKTKAKVSRKFNATIQIAGGDRFGRVYKISSFTDENKKNQKFKNFVIQPAGFPPKNVYEEAERVYTTFRTVGVQADHGSAGGVDDEVAENTNVNDRGGI